MRDTEEDFESKNESLKIESTEQNGSNDLMEEISIPGEVEEVYYLDEDLNHEPSDELDDPADETTVERPARTKSRTTKKGS